MSAATARRVADRVDVAVVGAGPAGATAAYDLARAGASVLLLDRARFPRDKPCGGALNERTVRILPVSVAPVVEHVADRLEVRFRYGPAFERRTEVAPVSLTTRRRLDAFLVEHAAAAGARVEDGVRATGVGYEGDRAWVDCGARRVRAGFVVGGDGVNGVTGRALGLRTQRSYCVALEGDLSLRALPARYRGRLVIELGDTLGGYGWLFPKADRLNVGVMAWQGEGPKLRERLERLCTAHGTSVGRLRDVVGYRLPLRTPGAPLARGPVVLVGDAAGVVDPFTGDGIYGAVLTGRLAAEAILARLAGAARSLEPYEEAVRRALDPSAAASWSAKRALDAFPRTTFRLARSRVAWSLVEALMLGEPAYLRRPGPLPRVALAAVGVLGRAGGAGLPTAGAGAPGAAAP